MIDSNKLRDRLANDVFNEDEVSHGEDPALSRQSRRSWNACAWHVANTIIPQLEAEQRINDGLVELRRQVEWLESEQV